MIGEGPSVVCAFQLVLRSVPADLFPSNEQRAGNASWAEPLQAAKLVAKVPPQYPEQARQEHLEGTVRWRALIDKNGSLRRRYVIKGNCSLADSVLPAVSQWRYTPTMFNGEPVRNRYRNPSRFPFDPLDKKDRKLSPPA
jgi:TonB family protein